MLQSDNAGIIFSERVINMPVGIVPPMYKMLIEEIQWAIDEVNIQLKETKFIYTARVE